MWCPKGSNIAEGVNYICYSNILGAAFPLVAIQLVGLSIFPSHVLGKGSRAINFFGGHDER